MSNTLRTNFFLMTLRSLCCCRVSRLTFTKIDYRKGRLVVTWEVVRIDNASDKGQILGHHVLEIVGDEDAPDVELDVFGGLAVVLEGVMG